MGTAHALPQIHAPKQSAIPDTLLSLHQAQALVCKSLLAALLMA